MPPSCWGQAGQGKLLSLHNKDFRKCRCYQFILSTHSTYVFNHIDSLKRNTEIPWSWLSKQYQQKHCNNTWPFKIKLHDHSFHSESWLLITVIGKNPIFKTRWELTLNLKWKPYFFQKAALIMCPKLVYCQGNLSFIRQQMQKTAHTKYWGLGAVLPRRSCIRILFFELKIEQPLDLKGWYKKLT